MNRPAASTADTRDAQQFARIAQAIVFLKDNFRDQPQLADVAAHVHLSPHHLQRLFSDWAGTSPKKFLQYISLAHAKRLLKEQHASLLDAAHDTGLSGTGRLHDLFVTIEGMTPAEYKHGGANLVLRHSLAPTPFGDVLVASTSKGICHMAFVDDERAGLHALQQHFPHAQLMPGSDANQRNALRVFAPGAQTLPHIKLHLKGSDFQLKVWNALLHIPQGGLSSYSRMAQHIERPQAARAVGTAIGSNPVAYLIPCHRVIQSSGHLGGYMWGLPRKEAMLGWEAARCAPEDADS